MFKPSAEKSAATITLINQVFSSKVPDAQKYTVAYSYFAKPGLISKSMYSYVVGFSEADKEIIVIPLDSQTGDSGEPMVFNKDNIISAKYGMQGDVVIKAKNLDKDLRFMVPGFTPPQLEDAYVLQVEQTGVATKFRDFVKKSL